MDCFGVFALLNLSRGDASAGEIGRVLCVFLFMFYKFLDPPVWCVAGQLYFSIHQKMVQPRPVQHPDRNAPKLICKELNSPAFLHRLERLGSHVFMTQQSVYLRIKSRWIGHAYYSLVHSKSRGVAILLHTSAPFVCSNVFSDPGYR